MAEQYDIRFSLMADAATTAAIQGGNPLGVTGGETRETRDNQRRQLQTQTKSLAALVGVQFSIAALLKNSQVFTGTIGALFQLLGAFIDITLAPLMPAFANVLSFIGSRGPGYVNFISNLTSQIATGIKNVGGFLAQIYQSVANIGAPVFSLFDKDGVSADGRLRLSDIIAGLGATVLGSGIFRALQTGSKTVVTATVGSLMQGTIGKLTGFIKGVSFISLIFSGLSIANIFETSGIEAGIIALADFMMTTIFASLGAVLGGLATAGSPIGVILGGALGGLGFQKFLSPRIFGGEGGMRAPGTFTAGDSAPAPPARAETYDRALAFPVSDTASFVASGNTNLYDYDRAVGRSMAGR
jgi:hypothetical protein